ncbi:hypothetical protein P4O66_021681 [Electrophorus voltai]|uniref:Uncharacterized protein n=1 Tax=Electrophorus voltai TaxID=2609070 RepID=A0AAD9E2W2_9TELE|nr:hypothetical protein P4O66_021681 [Electrophorus voltai]
MCTLCFPDRTATVSSSLLERDPSRLLKTVLKSRDDSCWPGSHLLQKRFRASADQSICRNQHYRHVIRVYEEMDVPTSVCKAELYQSEPQDSDHSGGGQHTLLENEPNLSPMCKTQLNPTETLEHDCSTEDQHILQDMEDEPSLCLVCAPEQTSVATMDSVCGCENQSKLQELEDVVPSLSLHCYSDPNPTEALSSDYDGGNQHTLQTPLKTCSVRLVDCRKMLELNENITAQGKLDNVSDYEEHNSSDADFLPSDGSIESSDGENQCSGEKKKKNEQKSSYVPCSVCGKKLSSLRSLKRHMKSHSGEVPLRPHTCSMCAKTFTKPSILKVHMVTHSGEKPFSCGVCGNRFTTKGNLKYHERTHTGAWRYQCSFCDKRFDHRSHLQKHERVHTRERPYPCSVCDRAFATTQALKTHLKIHTGEKPYHCSYCDMAFSQTGHLNRHKRLHTGEKPYLCDHCGKSFADPKHFYTHRTTHKGESRERPHQCSFCGKGFFHRINLKQHERIHTKERPYRCLHCDKSFARPDILKTHLRVHTGERPYHCSICGQSFVYLGSFRTHQKSHAILEILQKYIKMKKLEMEITMETDTAKIAEKENQLKKAKEEMDEATANLSKVKMCQTGSSSEITQLIGNQDEVLAIERKLADLQKTKVEHDDLEKELLKKKKKTEDKLNRLQKDGQELVSKILALQFQVREIQIRAQGEKKAADFQIADLQKQLRIKEKHISDLLTENEGLEIGKAEHCQDLEEAYNEIVDMIQKVPEANLKLILKNMAMLSDETWLKKRIAIIKEQTQTQIAELQEKISKNEELLRKKNTELDKAHSDVEKLTKEISDLQEELKGLKKMMTDVQLVSAKRLKELENELALTKEELKKGNDALKQKDSELATKGLEQELKEAKECSELNMSYEVFTVKTLTQEVEMLEKKISSSEGNVDALKQQLRKKNAELGKVQKEVKNSRAEYAELLQVLEKVRKLSRQQEQSIDRYLAEIARLEKDVEDLMAKLTAAGDHNAKQTIEVIFLKEELAKLEKLQAELKEDTSKKIADLEKQIAEKNKEIAYLKKSGCGTAQLKKEIAQLQQVVMAKEQQLTQLKKNARTQMAVVQRQLAEKTKKLETSEQKLKEKDSQNADLIDQLTELSKQLTEATSGKETITRALQRQILGLKRQVKDQEKEVSELQKNKAALRKALDRKQEELSKVKQELKEREAAITELDQRILRKEDELAREQKAHDDVLEQNKQLSQQLEIAMDKLEKLEVFLLSSGTVSPALDPDTAHRRLLLYEGNTMVRVSKFPRFVPENPERYDTALAALGDTGYESGRRYWEVQVDSRSCFVVGVATQSARRKGEINYGPKYGYWGILKRRDGSYVALTNKPIVLNIPGKLTVVGVLVDFSRGKITFYDAKIKTPIYTFPENDFDEPLYPYIATCSEEEGEPPIDVATLNSMHKAKWNCTEMWDSEYINDNEHTLILEDVPSLSPVCKPEPDCSTGIQHTLQDMEDEPSLSLICGPEQISVVTLDSVCDPENQSTLQELEEDVPSLSLHCYSDPNPTEFLASDCDGGDQHMLQTPLKTCSVRLVDCRKMLELNENITAQRDQSGGDEHDHEDDYQECRSFFVDKCEGHGPLLIIPDTPVPVGVTNRARQTLPNGLEIQKSSILGAGLGVFNKGHTVPVGAHFGPYQGELVDREEAMNSGYSWVIYNSSECEEYIDAERETHSNWMRYVNCARNDEEQNLVAFQYCGGILYRCCRPIKAGQELLVWYGKEYAKDLDITFEYLWNRKCSEKECSPKTPVQSKRKEAILLLGVWEEFYSKE